MDKSQAQCVLSLGFCNTDVDKLLPFYQVLCVSVCACVRACVYGVICFVQSTFDMVVTHDGSAQPLVDLITEMFPL